jgi:hypothetical protein
MFHSCQTEPDGSVTLVGYENKIAALVNSVIGGSVGKIKFVVVEVFMYIPHKICKHADIVHTIKLGLRYILNNRIFTIEGRRIIVFSDQQC